MSKKYPLKRPIQKIVRFSQEENEYIKEKVKRSPFNNFQNFARLLLLSGEVKIVDYSELRHLNGEVNRIGNNINQLAKLAHQFEEISQEDVTDLLEVLEEVRELVRLELKKEIKRERSI
ncbi:plasmid mobilization protein [Lactococcus garvieae]|uniref:plasmid mobilization protein n=1 Tax=Lactococcus garvieae TaxID=1363 RepID=UPI00254A150F|nr:plasmid mobilization relaxosome protein MobC [Lactococcus garvieae]